MRQRASNPTPSELSDSPMLGVSSRLQSEEPDNKDDLYLFTRGQVFKKSSRRFSVAPGSSTFPVPNQGMVKLPPPSYTSYHDSGFDAPGLMLGFAGPQGGFSTYPSHGNDHGYPPSSSTPGIPVHSLDLFQLENADQIPLFGPTADTGAGGTDPTGSTSSWLQAFGLPDVPGIGFPR